MDQIASDAQTLWYYLQLHQQVQDAEAIFVLCSLDTRVALRAAELWSLNKSSHVLVSGNEGDLTRGRFNGPEAHAFRSELLACGVPKENIIIENKSTNTGENVQFMAAVLKEKNVSFDSFLLVADPYSERRAYATFDKQWPLPYKRLQVTSPRMSFKNYSTESIPEELVIAIMVGDFQRVLEYPALGFQTEQHVPESARFAYNRLVAAGYTSRML